MKKEKLKVKPLTYFMMTMIREHGVETMQSKEDF